METVACTLISALGSPELSTRTHDVFLRYQSGYLSLLDYHKELTILLNMLYHELKHKLHLEDTKR